ncbi:MAG TPA: hypothetical protein VGU24_21275 [Microvirga sp.]|nr:hypothetical protein [Microvirga sp.]
MFAEFLLRNGRGFSRVLHLRCPGPQQNCFENAMGYAGEHGILYAEGYAFLDGAPIHHAWCLDGERVVETTWTKERGQPLYFGVVFEAKRALDRMCKTGIYGLFAPKLVFDIDFMSQVDLGLSAHMKVLETLGTT